MEKESKTHEKDSNCTTMPKEFFWDSLVHFVVSAILALAAVNIVSEFIRGGEVACFPPANNSEESEAKFINQFCTSDVPYGSYISFFMVLHGLLIVAPHYLWIKHFENNFKQFFELASILRYVKKSDSDHSNPEMLKSTLLANKSKRMFYLYVTKLVVQLTWAIGGLVFAAVFFAGQFGPTFTCPSSFSSNWPLDTKVICIFNTLNLLEVLWVSEILLLALAALGIVWALVWCFKVHPNELGSSGTAVFSFHFGLNPISKLSVRGLSCCGNFLTRYFMFCGESRIKSNLDFLIMKLHHSNKDLGYVIKEAQIFLHLQNLREDDQRRLSIHSRKHASITHVDTTGKCLMLAIISLDDF